MAIGFEPQRWEKIRRDYGAWWDGTLGRPLIHATIGGRDPGRPEPDLPFYGFVPFYDASVSPEAIVDRWDYHLSTRKFLGDAFPWAWPNYGAGVIAALLGCRLDPQPAGGTVWFHAPQKREAKDLHFRYDPDNPWLKHIKTFLRAAVDRWKGSVQVSMTDLGGNLDILSSFRPGELLLLDLYDCPDEVKRLTWEAHELWMRYFDEINTVLQPSNPGYTAWAPIFSEQPYYMLQCDFCYMISPAMFDEFVKPELAATCDRIEHAFYHLDGPGQLPHLDSLLEIETLDGVQWIPGEGSPPISAWPEVFRKIHAAGKRIQFYGTIADLDTIADQIGTAERIILITGGNGPDDEQRILEGLERYGAM
ncbi:MAG: hypothetical protein GX591_04485 [Planctomycetes bacterium]|nr:hypothetical protein [Planctomycetota bacterium]